MVHATLNVGFVTTLSGRWPRERPQTLHADYSEWARRELTGAEVAVYPEIVTNTAEAAACAAWLRARQVDVVLLVIGACVAFVGRRQMQNLEYPRKYETYVTYYADKYDLDPMLLYAFIRTESNFDPEAESSVGARGLMQITEDTFDWIKSRIAPTEALTFDDLYDPEVNIRFGSYFVAYCLLQYGDLSTAAAAYHSGLGTVGELLANPDYSADGQTLDEFPYPQMRRYVQKITDSYETYKEIYASPQ